MPIDPKVHAQLILDPDAFLRERGLDPAEFFVDHEGRRSPLVVAHVTGQVAHRVADDGTLAPFARAADPAAPPVTAAIDLAGLDAGFRN